VRVVLDTNVVASGLFFSGPPSVILEEVFSGRVVIVLTAEIIDEYIRVVAELSKRYPRVNAEALLDEIIRRGEVRPSVTLLHPVCVDHYDDKFFECAVAGKAKLIVSGDRHLLDASGTFDVEVLTPRAFVDNYLQG
jgi:putative PIN family toxin of toxin-antitoxin system